MKIFSMAKKLKIAVYHNLHSGGALRALYDLLKWVAKDHKLDLYSLSCSEQKIFNMASAVQKEKYYAFTPLPQLNKPFGKLNYAARYLDLFRAEAVQKIVAKDIDQGGYDVVFVHPCQFTQSPAVMRYLKTPTLYSCAEPLRVAYEPRIPRPYVVRSGLRRVLDRIDPIEHLYHRKRRNTDHGAACSASFIVVNSYYSREAIYRVYGKDSRVVYPGVDTEHFVPMNLEKEKTVFAVGALTPLKGFDFIVRSLAMIPEIHRPALTIASNYQEQAEKIYLEELGREMGVKINLLSGIRDDLLIRLYNTAQATICASVLEPFGLTPLESMACATPVVSVAEGGLRETLIHGQTGFYVDRDPSQCAEAVEQLICNPKQAVQMGHNGREHVVNNWTWEKSLPKLGKYLYECANSDK
jgi:glycosyltransferase involved in cell wall biosynthesis